ncbi:Protein ripply1 [Trichinella pseudospiralis]
MTRLSYRTENVYRSHFNFYNILSVIALSSWLFRSVNGCFRLIAITPPPQQLFRSLVDWAGRRASGHDLIGADSDDLHPVPW